MYWSTDAPVRAIAEEVGMSRSAVYGAIEPLGTGVRSPEGDADLVFTNRTNREQGLGTCPITGAEVSLEELKDPGASGEHAKGRKGKPSVSLQERAASIDPERAAKVAGIVGAGLGIGALAVKVIRDRS